MHSRRDVLLGMMAATLAALPMSAQTAVDPASEDGVIAAMRQTAQAWLEALGPELADQASFGLDDEERKRWSNLPSPMFVREGVSFGEMTPQQRVLAHRLIAAPLSSQGYLKASGIMRLDDLLREAYLARRPGSQPIFGHDRYWLGVFGDPAVDAAWGFQLDGHHLALNFTVVGDRVAVTPAFLGSDPAEVRDGAYAGWYILEQEDARGRALFESLDGEQRRRAILQGETPRDVITGPGRGDQLREITGLATAAMTASQRRLLLELLGEYLHNLEPALARSEMERIEAAGVDELHFSWAGVEEGKPYYYRIHGPTVLIEFDNSYPPGQGSGPINHIHSVWRDTQNDFGEDLLRKHYLESPHHRGERRDERPSAQR